VIRTGQYWIFRSSSGHSAAVADTNNQLLTNLLKRVSRSFYLTLRILPAAVRPQIGLAYLLARTTDTIADTGLVPVGKRLTALAALRARILGTSVPPEMARPGEGEHGRQSEATLDLGELAQHQGLPAEQELLEQIEASLALLGSLQENDLALVRKVIDTITSGQELDLLRFESPAFGGSPPAPKAGGVETRDSAPQSAPQPGAVIALQTEAELDDYTYRVAGCVGEFWTRMCRAHLFPRARLDETQLVQNGIRFGKGLQLVNILRDLPRDLQQGRCYIPAQSLAACALLPVDLLRPESEPRFRPVYHSLLDRAEAHLAAGWAYTNSIPPNQWRIRLACAWPILIGVRTLRLLRTSNVLDANQRVKVSRGEVKDLMLQTLLHVPFPGKFRTLYPARG